MEAGELNERLALESIDEEEQKQLRAIMVRGFCAVAQAQGVKIKPIEIDPWMKRKRKPRLSKEKQDELFLMHFKAAYGISNR